jgi:hypothetical protein
LAPVAQPCLAPASFAGRGMHNKQWQARPGHRAANPGCYLRPADWGKQAKTKERRGGGADQTARLRPVPKPVKGMPERIGVWVEVITGMILDDAGVVHQLDAAGWQERPAMPGGAGRAAVRRKSRKWSKASDR